MKLNLENAIQAIEQNGILLVFPIDNKNDPPSLWSAFHPRSEMRWEWDENGDDRVPKLWHLREELSRSGRVIYTKWFRGRATFFSPKIFKALIALNQNSLDEKTLSYEAKSILETLRLDSPLSTKVLKRAVGLHGRLNEASYQRALKELWLRFSIVIYGEVDEGAFPSVALGATDVLFEDLYSESRNLSRGEAWQILRDQQISSPLLTGQIQKQLRARDVESPRL